MRCGHTPSLPVAREIRQLDRNDLVSLAYATMTYLEKQNERPQIELEGHLEHQQNDAPVSKLYTSHGEIRSGQD